MRSGVPCLSTKSPARRAVVVLYKAASYAWRKGSLSDAEKLSARSLKVKTKLLGKEHEDTLSSMAMVGLAYDLGGRWKEAEKLEVQMMETSSRVLGEEHPFTLTSMANLAHTWKSQSRNEEAISLMEKCLELQKRDP